jgi:hypothetical protein
MSELHTITAGGTSKTHTGAKAFAYVSSVALASGVDAKANVLNIGTGAVLGLPYFLEKKGHVLNASINGVAEQINVPITMPEGATFEGSAEAAGEAAGNIVQEAMIAAMMPKVEDALALRLTQFAAMKGGGRKPAQARRA